MAIATGKKLHSLIVTDKTWRLYLEVKKATGLTVEQYTKAAAKLMATTHSDVQPPFHQH